MNTVEMKICSLQHWQLAIETNEVPFKKREEEPMFKKKWMLEGKTEEQISFWKDTICLIYRLEKY